MKFTAIRREPMRVTPAGLVRTAPLDPARELPLLAVPAVEGVELAAWLAESRERVDEALHRHGGVLFRGFALATPDDFARAVAAGTPELMEYTERSTPRSRVAGSIYTSTEYPPDQEIPPHNENSYSHAWPMRIWFFCEEPAASGGETPIYDSRRVYREIDPAVRDEFARRGVMYVRNFGESLGLSWQEAFQTTERAEVEAYCREHAIECEWRDGGRLRTRQVRQGVARHPVTGEMVWFNQAILFHVSSLDPAVRASLLSLVREEDLPRNACYGDGSPIDPGALEHVRRAYERAAVRFPWERGDLLLLDNMLAAHGRAPFTGARRTLVAMASAMSAGALPAAPVS